MPSQKRIGVFEVRLSTNPNDTDAICASFLSDDSGAQWWGPDSPEQLAKYIKKLRGEWILYAYDGGKRDFFYLYQWLSSNRAITIFDTTIVRAHMGRHQLRDAARILPFDLATHKAAAFEVSSLSRRGRNGRKEYILGDQHENLQLLLRAVSYFRANFGDSLTLSGAALREMRCFDPPVDQLQPMHDSLIRDGFYYGGRNQIFASGVFTGDVHFYDVNSMYPSVMVECDHPIGRFISSDNRIRKDTCFITLTGKQTGKYAAFARRNFDAQNVEDRLDWSAESGTFNVTIHEFEASQELGIFKVDKIIRTIGIRERGRFMDFVDYFHNKRLECGNVGDWIGYELHRYVLNSAYGKQGQDPSRYSDYEIRDYGGTRPRGDDWTPIVSSGYKKQYTIWSRPAKFTRRYNVACAASIAGAARAKLLRGIYAATRTAQVLYCDTDSILCINPARLKTNARNLGAWRDKDIGSTVALVRKKVYALFDDQSNVVKFAHAGVEDLSPADILRAAKGETVMAPSNIFPTFGLDGKAHKNAVAIRKVQL